MDPAGRDAGLVVLLLQSEWHQSLFVDPPDTLFHYTSAAGFQGIVDEAMLRATNFGFLNDPYELRYGKDLALRVLDHVAGSGPRARCDLIAELRNAVEAKAVSEVYVSCFTVLAHDPKLLALYGKFCIGVDGRKTASEFNKRPGGRFTRVIYAPAAQEQFIASILERCLTFVENNDVAAESWDGVADAFARTIHMRLPELKHPKYEHESEWRIIRWRDSGKDDVLSFDASGRPYLPVPRMRPLFAPLSLADQSAL